MFGNNICTMELRLTQDRLKELLVYDPLSGVFTWKVSRGNVAAGSIAGCIGTGGYLQLRVDGVIWSAHRLVWLHEEGYFPETAIDHIDRDRTNNRISNLRVVSHTCNQRNMAVRRDSKTGISGVSWSNKHGKWRARIKNQYKSVYLGIFSAIADAARARWDAEKKLGWPNCCTTSSAYLYLKENNQI